MSVQGLGEYLGMASFALRPAVAIALNITGSRTAGARWAVKAGKSW
jgi:hypothetical protein